MILIYLQREKNIETVFDIDCTMIENILDKVRKNKNKDFLDRFSNNVLIQQDTGTFD